MEFRTLSDINVKNKLVLLRIDINSPLRDGKLIDNPRIKEHAKTISELLRKGARVVIISHQGRKGQKDFISLKQHTKILSKHVKSNIKYIDFLFEDKAIKAIKELKKGKAILLKNVRFYNDEENVKNQNNKYISFSKNFDIYINDAFSVSHRAQGSIIIPPEYLPSAIGRVMERELLSLHTNKKSNKKVFLIGGAKVEDYFPIFNQLKNENNKVLASGVLGNLILVAKGHDLGYESHWLKSKGYFSLLPKLKELLRKYNNQIILPEDFGLIDRNNRRIPARLKDAPFQYKIFDVGPKTIELFKNYIEKSDYVFMKGPLGFSEFPEFSISTREILSFISQLSKSKKIYSILGGGHLTTTMQKYKISNNFNTISLSGGALLQYISGEKLPGLEALKNSKHKTNKKGL